MHHFILPTTPSLPCLRCVNVAAKVLAWLTVEIVGSRDGLAIDSASVRFQLISWNPHSHRYHLSTKTSSTPQIHVAVQTPASRYILSPQIQVEGAMHPKTILQCFAAILAFLAVPLVTLAQTVAITHGQKPNLPAPFATKSAGNGPDTIEAPDGFLPTVPSGFHINVFAKGFKRPRLLTVAPNGDIFLAETGANQVVVLRDPNHTGGAQERTVFASGLIRPFGIAFVNDYVYIGNMTSLVRFKFDPKTSKRVGEPEKLLDLPGGGHDTRNLAVTPDGKHILVAVGSGSNISTGEPAIRAAVTICDLDGKNPRQYATGLRNPVGLLIEPVTGTTWVTVNERDVL